MDLILNEQLSPNRFLTKEGYLVCKDVTLTKVGYLPYSERDAKSGFDGSEGSPTKMVKIHRTAENLFDEESMKSMNGKPVTIGHPKYFLNPLTWKEHAVGEVVNVRRGTSPNEHRLIGDLIVKDQEGIDYIESHDTCEVSVGVSSKIEQIDDTNYEARNLRYNHLALVGEMGRCGVECQIQDAKVTMQKKSLKQRILDGIDNFISGLGIDDCEKCMDDCASCTGMKDCPCTDCVTPMKDDDKSDPSVKKEETGNKEGKNEEGSGDKINETEADKEEKKEKDAMSDFATLKDAYDGLMKRMNDMESRFADYLETQKPTHVAVTDEEGDEDEETSVTDSISVDVKIQDAVSRAEALVPGIKVPAFDKSDAKKLQDSICKFKKTALLKAAGSDALARSEIRSMNTCAGISAAFNAATTAAMNVNSNIVSQPAVQLTDSDENRAPRTHEELVAEWHRQHGK